MGNGDATASQRNNHCRATLLSLSTLPVRFDAPARVPRTELTKEVIPQQTWFRARESR